jgi:hypothetical protein
MMPFMYVHMYMRTNTLRKVGRKRLEHFLMVMNDCQNEEMYVKKYFFPFPTRVFLVTSVVQNFA